jgi:TPR repeat protein
MEMVSGATPQDLGPPRKIVNFGIRYVVRDGWVDDEKIAFEHYMRTAELGHPESQYCLGLCYALGKGVEESYDTAMHWFEQAAAKDHPQSLYCKGMRARVCMYKGHDV